MTNYPLQNRPKKDVPLRKAVSVAAFIVGIILLVNIVFPKFFPSVFSATATPLWNVKNRLMTNVSKIEFLKTRKTLLEEVENLKTENEILRNINMTIPILEADNKIFRQILSREAGEKKRDAVSVLVNPPQTPYDVLIVDNPSGNVFEGGSVVLGSSALGTVSESLGGTLKIDLYSSAKRQTEGRLLPSGELLTLLGKGGGNFSVKLSKDFTIEVGQVVVLPGDPSFVIAHVISIDESDTNSFKTIFLTSPQNIFELRWVEIINAI